MPSARGFPPPWIVEEHAESFVVRDAKGAERSPNIVKLRERLRTPKARQKCAAVFATFRNLRRLGHNILVPLSWIFPGATYGGFSPVRLEGWLSKRCLPGSSEA
jgi:hypothetical protein